MEKQTILITGAGSGIGMALARKYNKLGWFVGMLDVNEKGLEELKAEFGEENCYAKKADITKEKDVNEAVKEFSDLTGGKLNVLSANAGIIVQKPFDEGTQKAYKKLIDVNAFGTVNTVYAALPMLKETPGARVVITSSSSAMFGIPDFAVYSSTKGFLRNLTEALNIEFEKHDIWVNDVMPLFVQTNMMNDIQDKYVAELTSDDVADAIEGATKNKKIHVLVGKGMKKMYFGKKLLSIKAFKNTIVKYLKYK